MIDAIPRDGGDRYPAEPTKIRGVHLAPERLDLLGHTGKLVGLDVNARSAPSLASLSAMPRPMPWPAPYAASDLPTARQNAASMSTTSMSL
jgi:hypothetical protein